jgi:sugar fermentation stimulation protein A
LKLPNLTSDFAHLTWPPLMGGTLIKRYKRFLADVRLDSGERVTAHCPNTGSMLGCAQPDRPVWVSFHDNPRRKLKYTWELIAMPDSLVGVNTQVPNRLVAAAIGNGDIAELRDYDDLQREVNVGHRTRIDLMLAGSTKPHCYIEIKNCTLVEDGRACFPDAVTARGLKHLHTLRQLVRDGHRAIIFYLIQRMDAIEFRPADRIDSAYGEGLRQAVANGVELLAYDVAIDLQTIRINRRLPCLLT